MDSACNNHKNVDITSLTPALREACGVVGVYFPAPHPKRDIATLAYYALASIQHRGQESAGIATCDANTKSMRLHKGMGLVSTVFKPENIDSLSGTTATHALGHCRYSTVGDSDVKLAQPFCCETSWGPLLVAHNGTLTMTKKLHKKLMEWDPTASYCSDSEMILAFLMHVANGKSHPNWVACIEEFMHQVDAAYSLIIMTDEALYAVRDVYGVRPLVIGQMKPEDGSSSVLNHDDVGYLIASESCAFATVQAKFLREVQPGEIVAFSKSGVTSTMFKPLKEEPERPLSMCVFEFVYFSRPDSVWNKKLVHQVRQRCGIECAKEFPTEADVVFGVPDSSLAAAIGYAVGSGIPYTEGLSKNKNIGRTFIQPDQKVRISKVKLKYNVLEDNIRDQRIVVVDDSLVRGTTMKELVRLFRDAGAKEVHVRIASPPIRYTCHMGVAISTFEELVAYRLGSIENICEYIGADSLYYLSHNGMMKSVHGKEENNGFCSACFSGVYDPHPDPQLEW